MDDGAAGEVEDAELEEPAAFGPDHVGEWAVDEGGPEDDEEDVGAEGEAFGDGAGDEGGCDDGELALEHGEDELGDALVGEELVEGEALEGDVVPVPADDAPSADGVAEGEGVADQHPVQADDGHGDEGVEHGGEDVFASHHAGVEEGEAGDHEEHERGGHEHPGGAAGVELLGCGGGGEGGGGGLGQVGGLCECEEGKRGRGAEHACSGWMRGEGTRRRIVTESSRAVKGMEGVARSVNVGWNGFGCFRGCEWGRENAEGRRGRSGAEGRRGHGGNPSHAGARTG